MLKYKTDMKHGASKRKIMKNVGCFIVLFLLAWAIVPAEWWTPGSASSFEFPIDPTGYYLKLSSLGTLNIEVNPGENHGLSAAKDVLNIKTNIRSGYKLFLSTDTSGEAGEKMKLEGNDYHYFNPTVYDLRTPGLLEDNTWGFALRKGDSPGFSEGFDEEYMTPIASVGSKWAKVPRIETPVSIAKYSPTNYISGILDNSLDIFYGVHASTLLPAGNYHRGILYSAIGNTDNSSNAMPEQNYIGTVHPNVVTNTSGGETINITTSLYTTSDIGAITVRVGDKICVGASSTNNDGIVKIDCQTPANNEGRYNVLIEIPKYSLVLNLPEAIEYRELQTTFNSITTMQEMTPDICEAETTPYAFQNGEINGEVVSTTTKSHSTNKNLVPEAILRDIRDGKTYTVRKLADGKCWMVQNLDFDLSTNSPLTPLSSDIDNNWVPNNNTQDSTGVNWGDSGNSNNQAHSYDPGNIYLVNQEDGLQTIESSGPRYAHIGNLYNWYSATAGTGTSSLEYFNDTAKSSICPKGWRLPYENGRSMETERYGDFESLTNVYKITPWNYNGYHPYIMTKRIISSPLSFVYSGYYLHSSSSHYGMRSISKFLSSSIDRQHVNLLKIDSSSVSPRDDDYRANGYSVRCLARSDMDKNRTIFDISNMQEMTSNICKNTTTPVTSAIASTSIHSANTNLVPERELRDIRDNKTYIVRKLADGNCWMVQNLDLDLLTSIPLTPETSDISTQWTPYSSTNGLLWPNTNDKHDYSYDPGEKYLTGTGSANQTISYSGPKTAHIGNLYNWHAATAGTGSNISRPGQEAIGSICPRGWKLPYGNISLGYQSKVGDFQKLTDIYGVTPSGTYSNNVALADKLLSFPLSFVRSGGYSSGNNQVYDQGYSGSVWARSSVSSDQSHVLQFYPYLVNSQSYKGIVLGLTVRCLAR